MSVRRETAVLEVPVRSESSVRCSECAARVCAGVERLGGVLHVECDPRGTMRVDYDAESITPDRLLESAQALGAQFDGVYEHALWRVGGLDCPDCARTLAKSVEMLPEVGFAELNFASGTLLVEHRVGSDPSALVERAVQSAGHSLEGLTGVAVRAADHEPRTTRSGLTDWVRTHRTEFAVVGSGAFIALGWLVGLAERLTGVAVPPAVTAACFLVAVAFGETLLGPRAAASLRTRSLDMNVLMTLAVLGAIAIGEFEEAATVVFLFALGGWLEARALNRTRSSIRGLMDLAPPLVRVRRDGTLYTLPPEEARVGDIQVVRPGDRVALDGEVVSGVSAVEESAITGESTPVHKQPGDLVFAGTLNGTGLLEARITSVAADSTLARIVYLVEEAQASRAPSQLLVDRFSRVYTPVAVVVAVLVAFGPPVAAALLGTAVPAQFADWGVWFYRGLVVLVASCPCALVISTPVTFVSAIARAGRDGVLVKGGAYLELAARVKAIAFDKTGTLTQGRPAVVSADAVAGGDVAHVTRIAAALERDSTHPLAGAVREYAAAQGIAAPEVTGFEELPGRGVMATMDGVRCALVSPGFAEEIGDLDDALRARIGAAEDRGGTVLVLVEDGVVTGFISVADPLREGVAEVVSRLSAAGVEHMIMLTGDNERTAAAVAQTAGIGVHMARLLPEDKVDAVLRVRDRYGTVAMVGDGVNDAPALAVADVGLTMGAAGSDTALETADVALLGDDITALPAFFALGRRTLAIVRANVWFSVVAKLFVLVAAVFGYANMWLAVFADTGVALLVIANGMRLLGGGTGASARRASASTEGERWTTTTS